MIKLGSQRNMKKNLNNKGSLTLLFVIVILIAATVVLGYLNISVRTIATNEIQGIMDESGIVALRKNVDENRLRLEEIVINTNAAEQTYRQLINSSISTGNGNLINNYRIDKVRVYPPNHSNLKNLGIPNGQRDQYFIESIISVEYQKEPFGSGFVKAGVSYFDYLTGNSNRRHETNMNNQKAIVLRSVSRLVLR